MISIKEEPCDTFDDKQTNGIFEKDDALANSVRQILRSKRGV